MEGLCSVPETKSILSLLWETRYLLRNMIEPNEAFRTMVFSEGSLRWSVPAELPYLDGHFPGMPVLPAVAMVDAAAFILQRKLQRPDLYLRSVVSAKFLSPIGPGRELEIVTSQTSESEWQMDWKEASSGNLLATLRVQAS